MGVGRSGNLGYWSQELPYDVYLSVRLAFDPSVVGQLETFKTLAIVCLHPPGAIRSFLIVGTNTDLIRRLLTPIVSESDPATKVPGAGTEIPNGRSGKVVEATQGQEDTSSRRNGMSTCFSQVFSG